MGVDELLDRLEARDRLEEEEAKKAKERGRAQPQSVQRRAGSGPPCLVSTGLALDVAAAFRALERRRPDHVDDDAWLWAVDDGRRFLVEWGAQAEALGWTVDDIFGLPPVPGKPASNYRRLARYDLTGLAWLLRGRPVVALTADSAAIRTPGGGQVTFYRKRL